MGHMIKLVMKSTHNALTTVNLSVIKKYPTQLPSSDLRTMGRVNNQGEGADPRARKGQAWQRGETGMSRGVLIT